MKVQAVPTPKKAMSGQPEAVTLDLLSRLIQAEQHPTREPRREEVSMLDALVDRVGRMDRHIANLRSDASVVQGSGVWAH